MPERRLAAIVATDVVGYSRLIGADEEGTRASMRRLGEDLWHPKTAQHKGRVVNTTGDGQLLEFPSVVDAVRYAVEVQQDLSARNAKLAKDKRIELRVGVNIGDILVEGDDIHGDGVNVAARLETLAEPGGVCVSRKVRDEVRDKLAVSFEDLGDVEVKNIVRPIRTFRLGFADYVAAPYAAPILTAAAPAAPAASTNRLWQGIAGAAIAAALIAIYVVTIWQPWVIRVEAANVANMALPLPDKPSLVVLPFDNLSGDPDQDYLVDGLTEDITTALARLPSIFVMSRNSTMTYKGREVKAQQVAEDLGVQFVLEGSVQREGDRLRVNAQLIDALSGRYVWADKFDREVKDLFAVKDEITLHIASNISAELGFEERDRLTSRGTDNLDAWLLYKEGVGEVLKFTPESNLRGRELLARAMKLDPSYSAPVAWMANGYRQIAQYGFDDDPAGALVKGFEYVERARDLNGSEALAFGVLALLNVASRQIDEALEAANKAFELQPDYASHGALGWLLNFAGRPEEARDHLKLSIRLNPSPPEWVIISLGDSYLLLDDYDEAERMYKRLGVSSRFFEFWHQERLALVFAATGREDEARESIARAVEIYPPGSIKLIRDTDPYKDQSIVDGWVETLRRLGLPE